MANCRVFGGKQMKPMLFNMPMVQAIQSGTKTVTRRAMKPQPTAHLTCGPNWKELLSAAAAPYHPGDVLWVRETWRKWSGGYSYKADAPDWACQWKPSIHMPREAARLFLRVTDVWVERLQNIQPSGAINEGACEACEPTTSIIPKFVSLWDSTIKTADLPSYGWNANPWVWVIEFERCEKPIEEE